MLQLSKVVVQYQQLAIYRAILHLLHQQGPLQQMISLSILDKAREEASQIIAEAKDAGENLKNKLSEEGQEKYETLISNAKADIESAKDQALNDIKTMVVEIALEASEKIIKRNLNNEDNKNIIEKTVKSFQEKN